MGQGVPDWRPVNPATEHRRRHSLSRVIRMRSSERGGAVMFNLNTLIGSTTEAILVAGNCRSARPIRRPSAASRGRGWRAGAIPTLAGPAVCGSPGKSVVSVRLRNC
jgi:hypothetical protein